MSDTVFVRGLVCRGVIGVDDAERCEARPLSVDLELETDCSDAARSDDLARALDYRAVAERVQAVVADSSYRLLEALAERIAGVILEEFPAAGTVRVRISKPRAVAGADTVGVEITRRWGDTA